MLKNNTVYSENPKISLVVQLQLHNAYFSTRQSELNFLSTTSSSLTHVTFPENANALISTTSGSPINEATW